MARRTERAAQEAAQQASEAARVLQARGQEKVQEKPQEPVEVEPKQEVDHDRREKLLNQRPQIQAMEEIMKKRGLSEEPKEEPKVEEKKEEPEAKAEPEVPHETKSEVEPQDTVPAEEPKVKTIRVKVDGEEFDAPAEEVEAYGGVRPYQIAKAGENRLKKLGDAIAEIRRVQPQPQRPQQPQLTDQQFIAASLQNIRFGNDEEGAKALVEVINRYARPVDPNALSNQITERMRNEQAVSEFRKEFSDIASNPILYKTAMAVERERFAELARTQQGPVDWQVFYRKIGNEVRSAFGRSSQPPSTQTAGNTSQSKEAKKASITTLPTASARAALPEEEKTPTPEEYRRQTIDEMKKKRGQSTG